MMPVAVQPREAALRLVVRFRRACLPERRFPVGVGQQRTVVGMAGVIGRLDRPAERVEGHGQSSMMVGHVEIGIRLVADPPSRRLRSDEENARTDKKEKKTATPRFPPSRWTK